MARFKDAADREWDVVINVAQVEKIRELYNIDLMRIDKPEGQQVFQDIVTFVHVMYLLVETQATERGVNEKGFADQFYGDTFDGATDALIKALSRFFPKHRRTILERSAEKTRELQDAALAKAMKALDEMTLETLIQ